MPTILYAEDDPDHRSMVRMILSNHKITLIEAENGYDAIEKIRRQQPDIILLDLFMPNLDGFKVLEIIKSDSSTCHIPVIVLSAWPTGDNQERARLAGATEFIPKPYEPPRLVQLILDKLEAQNLERLPAASIK